MFVMSLDFEEIKHIENMSINVCNVSRFRGNQKYRKPVHGDEKQDTLSPLTAIF